MEVITIESKAFQEILNRLEEIRSKICLNDKENALNDLWLNSDEVIKILKISKRTLQKYRNQGLIGFSQTGSKIYYRATDLERYLENSFKPIIKITKE